MSRVVYSISRRRGCSNDRDKCWVMFFSHIEEGVKCVGKLFISDIRAYYR